jgi:hypothetical protein
LAELNSPDLQPPKRLLPKHQKFHYYSPFRWIARHSPDAYTQANANNLFIITNIVEIIY